MIMLKTHREYDDIEKTPRGYDDHTKNAEGIR